MSPKFFSPGDSHTKGLLVLLHLDFEDITKVDTHPKGRVAYFKVPPEFSVFILLQGIAPGNG